MTPRERLDAIEALLATAAASSTAAANEWWAARSRLAEKDVPALVAFARAVLDTADGATGRGVFVMPGTLRRLADEHLGGESDG